MKILVAGFTTVATFALLHLIGARSCVGMLSGTLPPSEEYFVLGIGYVLTWFGTVIAVPIALLALLLDRGCGRLVQWRRTPAR